MSVHHVLRRAIVVIGAIALVLVGCSDDESAGSERGTDVEDLTDGPDDEVIDQDVFEDPGPLAGETVTVSGEVSDVFSEQAFTIAGEDAGGEALLVLRQAGRELVGDENVVRVTGVVRLFRGDPKELDLELASDDDVASFEGEYVIVASEVEQLDPAEGSGADDD